MFINQEFQKKVHLQIANDYKKRTGLVIYGGVMSFGYYVGKQLTSKKFEESEFSNKVCNFFKTRLDLEKAISYLYTFFTTTDIFITDVDCFIVQPDTEKEPDMGLIYIAHINPLTPNQLKAISDIFGCSVEKITDNVGLFVREKADVK